MKRIDLNIPPSPRSQLRIVNKEASEIDNKLIQLKNRDRNYCVSARNLYGDDLNKDISNKWEQNLITLNEVIQKGENACNQINDYSDYADLEKTQYLLFQKKFETYIESSIIRSDKERVEDAVNDINLLVLRMEKAFKGNRDYSPSNLRLNEETFFYKRKEDLNKNSKQALAEYNKIELLNNKLSAEEKLAIKQKIDLLNDKIIPKFEEYYEKEISDVSVPVEDISVTITSLKTQRPIENTIFIERDKLLKQELPIPSDLQTKLDAVYKLNSRIKELENQLNNPKFGETKTSDYPQYKGMTQAELNNLQQTLFRQRSSFQNKPVYKAQWDAYTKQIEDINDAIRNYGENISRQSS